MANAVEMVGRCMRHQVGEVAYVTYEPRRAAPDDLVSIAGETLPPEDTGLPGVERYNVVGSEDILATE